jgi:hypothetical protein
LLGGEDIHQACRHRRDIRKTALDGARMRFHLEEPNNRISVS